MIIDILVTIFLLSWLSVGISVITNYIKHNWKRKNYAQQNK